MKKTILLLAALLLVPCVVSAQEGEPLEYQEEWGNRIKQAEAIAPLGDTMFGDSVNYYNGQTSFSITDIDLPGNSALPVRLSRTRSAAHPEGSVIPPIQVAGWDLELPYVSGIFAENYGWKVDSSTPFNRCSSSTFRPPSARNTTPSRFWGPNTYWRGNSISIPGSGSQLMLSPGSVPAPTDGQSRRFVTANHWQIRCLSSLANPSSAFQGEGFLAIAPDGTRYTFNWMTSRVVSALTRPALPPPGSTGPASGYTESLRRVEVRIYATRVEDRFGNWVNYEYSGSTITRITANDGRTISFSHDTDGNIATASAHDISMPASAGRIWTYTGGRVTLPDGTFWIHSFPNFRIAYNGLPVYAPPCYRPGTWAGSTQAGRQIVITHPSGARGEFNFEPKRHGRYRVTNDCLSFPGGANGAQFTFTPLETDNFALTRKRITGPGLEPTEWTVSYSSPESSFDDGAASYIGPPKTVTATNPDGSASRYSFGTTYYVDDGKLLRTDTLSPTGAVLKSEVNTYATNPANPPYAYSAGSSGVLVPDSFAQTHVVPRVSTVTTVNGDTFTNRVDAFDRFAREATVRRSNSFGYSRTDTTAYHDNLAKWVIGQVASVTHVETGEVVRAKQFSSSTALPIRSYKFGLLQNTYAYHGDGTLASMTNGVGNWVAFNNWKRGAPQLIQFPGGVSRSGVIDYYGLISSVTDERGSTTGYTYDAMGRLSTVTYPTGDTVNWATKTLNLFRLVSPELGQPVGSWRMRLNEGDYQRTVYLDSRYNPVLEEERDQATGAARYLRRSFDWMGRATFESYPSALSLPTAGVQTEYDYLGRMKGQQTTDGVTLSTVNHLAGNRRQTVDADGKSTTVSYQAWDAPAYDAATLIAAAEGQTTTMDRDAFGMLQRVTQAGLYQGSAMSYTRTYSYDIYKRLCRRQDPESGATLFGYDDASQLKWEAKGEVATACTASVPVGATQFHYDVRGRKIFDDYPGTASDTAFGFDNAGNLIRSSNAVATWTYSYNKRNILEAERAQIDGRSFVLNPDYNSRGQVKDLTYPNSLKLSYAPNAWGEPTQLGTSCCGNSTSLGALASDVQYHPNGRVASYTLGNGLTYQQGLDPLQRPNLQDTRYGGTVFQRLNYVYSNGGNLKQITDDVNGTNSATFDYDNLNRLTTASGLWGSYTYGYDPINNLRSRTGTNPLGYAYQATSNRLMSVTGTPVAPTPTATLPAAPPGGATPSLPAAPNPGTPPAPIPTADPTPPPPPPPPPLPPKPPGPVDPCLGVQCGPAPESSVQSQSVSSNRTFGYDSRGRINVDGNRTYTWNDADQIVTMPGIAHYAYDGNGKRIRTVKPGNKVEYALYSLSGTLTYVFYADTGKNSAYAQLDGKTIVEVSDGAPTYLHADLLGSPRRATNGSRQLLWDEHYAPYGEKLNGVAGKIGYTGHAHDSESGLTYAQARFYDSVMGRFLSIDPVGFTDSAFTFNRYGYANNNPYRYIDPDGRSCTSANGETTCSVPVLGSRIPQKISFPTPKEFPVKIDSTQGNYHSYDKTVSAGSNSAGKADEIREGIKNDPTPGNDQPATEQGTANDASPQAGLLRFAGKLAPSPVMSYARKDDAGNSVVVNVTLPGHPLFPGYVARIVQNVNGEAIVHNVGEGTAPLQSPESPFAGMINNVWINQSQQIIDRVR